MGGASAGPVMTNINYVYTLKTHYLQQFTIMIYFVMDRVRKLSRADRQFGCTASVQRRRHRPGNRVSRPDGDRQAHLHHPADGAGGRED